MCHEIRDWAPRKKPEYALAEILHEATRLALGGAYYVDPEALRDLIQTKWDRISTLAHAIHADKPREKTTREKVTPGHHSPWSELHQGLGEMLDRLEAVEKVLNRSDHASALYMAQKETRG